jgi:hypothetical protein
MNQQPTPSSNAPSFLRRIPLAISTFFNILFNGDYAARVIMLRQPMAPTVAPMAAAAPAPAPAMQEPLKPTPPPPMTHAPATAALQLLSLFQREARLIDFTQEDLSVYADADIGAAARVVHAGCRKVLQDHFSIGPIRTEAEGSRLTLAAGFDAAAIRLTGNVTGSAPFHGSLSHAGWRASEVRLPKLAASHDSTILAPAEVEL